MGTFTVPLEVADPRSRRYETVAALVDSGATCTALPISMLQRLGVVAHGARRFVLADGRRLELGFGRTWIRLDGREEISPVVFQEDGAQPLLGAVTLEIFGLGIDPVQGRLIPVDAFMLRWRRGDPSNRISNHETHPANCSQVEEKHAMAMELSTLREAVSGTAAAFRCVTDYQPVGGPGDKVFPPTYEGGKYATEERVDPETGEIRHCVLLDSVQSQANRMELALLEAHRNGTVHLPLLATRFDQEELLRKFTVTSLEAPHRVADALFRDSLLKGTIFRKSEKGRILDTAEVRNATGLFGLCPTALVFGLWDSTGPRGGLGCKFQRAVVSEITGYGAVAGVKTKSRIDPAEIMLGAGPLYNRNSSSDDLPDWTLDEKAGSNKLGKDKKGKPSEANHGNVTPSIAEGGFTISGARQTTTLSLAVLRRLRFPLDGAADSDHETDLTARTALAALGLAAGALARVDTDLRSRCQLFAEQEPVWELLDRPGEPPRKFELGPEDALRLLEEATAEAKDAGLPWEGEIELTPSPDLVALVRGSQELASASGGEED